MKIERVEVIQIETPRYYGSVSGHVLVKVHVDDGPVGFEARSDGGGVAAQPGGGVGVALARLWFEQPDHGVDEHRHVAAGCKGGSGHRASVAGVGHTL